MVQRTVISEDLTLLLLFPLLPGPSPQHRLGLDTCVPH